ncbi:RNA polymerase subunit sigma-70 [Lachnospiraceae bacterium]|nr:RNA polymerase subunit sigma-70 [Lachnospiraceae bacterium]
MTDAQKENIRYLRGEGLGYRAIAARLGISENTVKSFCRRSGLTGIAKPEPAHVCRQCGQPLVESPKRKGRKFCSEACRRAWWKEHAELIDRKAFYSLFCAECGKEFLSYGNQKRKYCSHACYIKARFKKGGGHDEGTV